MLIRPARLLRLQRPATPVERLLDLCGRRDLAPGVTHMLFPKIAPEGQTYHFFVRGIRWMDCRGLAFAAASGTRVEMYDKSGVNALPLLLLYFDTERTAGEIATLTGAAFKAQIASAYSLDVANVATVSITPPDYNNMVGWWDAAWASNLANNDPIGALHDKGRLGSTLSQTGEAALKPTRKINQINGLPTVYFDGGDYFCNDALAPLFCGEDQPLTSMIVLKRNSKVANDWIATLGKWGALSTSYSLFLPIYYANTGDNKLKHCRCDDAGGIAAASGPDAGDTTVPHVGCFKYGPTTASTYKNGAVIQNAASSNVGAITLDTFTVGVGRHSASLIGFLAGHIAELLLWKSAITDAQRQAAEAYLAAKWGITL
jgi:hypothetical protein